MKWLAAAFWVLAAPVAAQEISFDPSPTTTCIASGGGIACAGRAAQACTEQPDAYTTVGMGFCFGAERDWWDDRLNQTYRQLLRQTRRQDTELAELGSSLPPVAPMLQDMQRAWIPFRDAACAYEYSTWGGGTGGGPAHANCMMTLTAEQTLRLEARLSEQ